MSDTSQSAHDNIGKKRLYNIIILRGYISYIQQQYPKVDINQLLESIGVSYNQLDDSRFWFSQEQADRFYAKAQEMTGNPNLAREAGQNSILGSASLIYQYIAGFLGPSAGFETVQMVSTKLSKGAKLTAKKLGPHLVELLSVPAPGVDEKPYQCENRTGVLEAVGKIFTGKLATVKHPECIHRGDKQCRYLISWEEPKTFIWKRIRNYLSILGVVALIYLAFLLTPKDFTLACLIFGCLFFLCNWLITLIQYKESKKNTKDTGKIAGMLLEEIDSRSNDALLMQEIGLISSSTLDINQLLAAITPLLKKRLNFDRGAVMLMDAHTSSLRYSSGFGYNRHVERLMRKISLNIDKFSKEVPLAWSIRSQSPYVVNDIDEILPHMTPRNRRHIKRLGVRAFVQIPILYENKVLGIVLMERNKTAGVITQNEVSLLVGIAQQIGIIINNINYFKRLMLSEERYRELVESANSIILRIDMLGRITFYNDFAHKFFGYDNIETDADGSHAMTIPDESLRESIQKWLGDFTSDPEKFMNTQTELALRDGRRVWIAWTNRPIRDEQHNLVEVLCIGNDITELKCMEQENIKLEVDLQRAQKMEALGTLAGGVAHDLNNILSSVVSYPDLLLLKMEPEDPLVKPLESIRNAGVKAAAIVQDLLTMARRGVSISKVVNLNTIIASYLDSVEFEALCMYHPHLKVETDLESSLLNVMGSEVHLSKTIMNLVNNAAEAMPEHGTIKISTQSVYVDKDTPSRGNLEEGDYILLRVADTGIGIKPEDLPHVFEPFYTKKVMGRSGTGLGMAVIWGTVNDHHGHIDIDSTVGKGTTIDIYLPVTRLAPNDDKSSVDFETMRGNETVLVVDDIAEQRDIAQALLSELGYQVETAASGEDAVKYLHAKDANILLLDMIMDPGMDGLETFQQILHFKPEQKAIIVSGFSETGKVKQALRLGAGAYVKKPYVLGKIGRVVRDELDRSGNRQ